MGSISRAAVVLCLTALGLAVAQVAQEDIPTLKVDVNIVNILFAVHDKRGGLVGNLDKDAFQVFEDGKEQSIRYFARETDLPLTIGLLIDVSRSMENLIEVEKRAADQFLTGVLRPKDMAFIISFGPEAELLQDFTNSRKLLRAALNDLRVRAPLPTSAITGNPGPVPTAAKGKGTVLYDAVTLGASDRLRKEVGRKAIVVISDGVDSGSSYSIRDAIEAAHKSDAIIYGIYYSDPQYAMFGGGEGELKRMAEDTGGRVFRISRKHTLADIFSQIQEEMRSQYAIGYTPSNSVRDGSFRKVEIRTKQKDLRVRARKGYYAMPERA
ncbi:MAG TPA: VWA domain-containing protein [Bryobacteraceae bacterium]|nr:VWA domain-containing protein [Bryobacteraceae bacterium]